MHRLTICLAAASLAIACGATSVNAAAPTSYYHKKLECARAARAMHFGIHFIRRQLFIRKCMARE